jgi:hypothetical protein
MLLTIYILFQILVIAGILLVFYSKEIIFSALTMLFSGVLAVGSWRLFIGVQYVFDTATGSYIAENIIVNTSYLAYLNMGLFGLAMVFFFNDLFEWITKESVGLGNLNMSRNKKTEENLQTKNMP